MGEVVGKHKTEAQGEGQGGEWERKCMGKKREEVGKRGEGGRDVWEEKRHGEKYGGKEKQGRECKWKGKGGKVVVVVEGRGGEGR